MKNQGIFPNDWLELQRKYWDGWTEMSRKSAGFDTSNITAPWEGALDHWWQAMSPAAAPASKEFMERLIEQGKVFFRMGELFTRGVAGNSASDGWLEVTKSLEDLQEKFRNSVDDSGDTLHRMMAFWELPYDNWQRMMSSLAPTPGDLLRNMPHDQMRGHLDKLLSAPGLGYTREEQAQYQDLMRRAIDYQKVLNEYLIFYSRLGVKAVERMQGYVKGVVESGKSIDSARALYDGWVDCCESVYAEEVASPEYAQIHGHLINAQMALKHRMSIMVDETLGTLNMPTRSELRTLQVRLQETRRENKSLRRALQDLTDKVAALASAEPPAQAPIGAGVAAAPARRAASTAARTRTVARKKPVSGPSGEK